MAPKKNQMPQAKPEFWSGLWHFLFHPTCPSCHKAALFRSFLKFHEVCPNCGFLLQHWVKDDGPAVFAIFILGFVVVPLALLVDNLWNVPTWVHILLWPSFIGGGTILLLRPLKIIWIFCQDRYDPAHDR